MDALDKLPNPIVRPMPNDPTRFAPEGQCWICGACGKLSPYDNYGDTLSDWGWDVSCTMNAILINSYDATKIRKEREEING